jgi:hypothetical protein
LLSKNIVPYITLFNKEPDYSQMWVLGCLCFTYTRPYNKHKLEPRSQLCVFIGYGLSQKGYRYLNLSSNKNFMSRSVLMRLHFHSRHNPVILLHPLWKNFILCLWPWYVTSHNLCMDQLSRRLHQVKWVQLLTQCLSSNLLISWLSRFLCLVFSFFDPSLMWLLSHRLRGVY